MLLLLEGRQAGCNLLFISFISFLFQPAATIDRMASGTLAIVEEKCPIITKTPTEVLLFKCRIHKNCCTLKTLYLWYEEEVDRKFLDRAANCLIVIFAESM